MTRRTLLLLLWVCLLMPGCAAKRTAKSERDTDYPYKSAVDYRNSQPREAVKAQKGHPLPPRPAEGQNEALIFPGVYIPQTGKGRVVLQKLATGDYFFQGSIIYGKNASTFENICYQLENRLICPIDYDVDEEFNSVPAYFELEQLNPADLKLSAHYTLPGLFGEGLPELFRRRVKAAPVKKALPINRETGGTPAPGSSLIKF